MARIKTSFAFTWTPLRCLCDPYGGKLGLWNGSLVGSYQTWGSWIGPCVILRDPVGSYRILEILQDPYRLFTKVMPHICRIWIPGKRSAAATELRHNQLDSCLRSSSAHWSPCVVSVFQFPITEFVDPSKCIFVKSFRILHKILHKDPWWSLQGI